MKKICFVFALICLINKPLVAQPKNNSGKYEEGIIETEKGVSIFYQKVGQGKQKIIIPAGYWLCNDFKHLADSADRTIVFFDMRDRGRSSHVEDTCLLDIRKEIEDIEAIRKYFKFDKINLVGWSYLGFLVILYTEKYPQNVDRIIQIGPVPAKWNTEYPDSLRYQAKIPGDEIIKTMLDSLQAGGFASSYPMEFSRLLWQTVNKRGLVGDPNKILDMGAQWGDHIKYPNEWVVNFSRHLKYSFRSVQAMNAHFEDYKKIQQPVLVIHGTRDRNAPFGSGKQWASTLINGRLLRIEGAAHIPWVEQPRLVFSAINSFLKGAWPPQAVKPK
jgi:proline iminopeptidase